MSAPSAMLVLSPGCICCSAQRKITEMIKTPSLIPHCCRVSHQCSTRSRCYKALKKPGLGTAAVAEDCRPCLGRDLAHRVLAIRIRWAVVTASAAKSSLVVAGRRRILGLVIFHPRIAAIQPLPDAAHTVPAINRAVQSRLRRRPAAMPLSSLALLRDAASLQGFASYRACLACQPVPDRRVRRGREVRQVQGLGGAQERHS